MSPRAHRPHFGAHETSAAEDISSELLRRGWIKTRSSEVSALWVAARAEAELYVPHRLRRDTLEWEGVLARIAAPTSESPADIEKSIEQLNYDVVRFRVNASGETIPLESAATVISSAFGMLRAAATSARRPQRTIRNYSAAGDEIAASARLGHTEAGSFVFPVLLHVDEPEGPLHEVLDGVESVVPESEQRRVTRTLAQAMDAFDRQIVRPGAEPTARNLLPLVYAGGTKELFSRVAGALAEPDIAFLETSFAWAGREANVAELPRTVLVPADAAPSLAAAAKALGEAKRDPLRVLVGPIIRIEHVQGEPYGEIVMQAPGPAGGRKSRVEMRVRAEQLGELHEWMHRGTTVVVEGLVQTRPGRYAFLSEVGVPRPLSETLDVFDA